MMSPTPWIGYIRSISSRLGSICSSFPRWHYRRSWKTTSLKTRPYLAIQSQKQPWSSPLALAARQSVRLNTEAIFLSKGSMKGRRS
uniref:Secreted protein n=1 Tax=Echinococcus granulosus TaxID=6210 RepID=A0A068WXE5_ECHGR|nr:hypothetical protein EgrG_002028500 [Echinococcus granulosus]